MKVSYDWLKDYSGDSLPTPEKLEELLTFHAFEVEGVTDEAGQAVIDIDVLPNRSSDCLCHRGIAREVANITGVPLVHDPLAGTPSMPATDAISVEIEDTKACPRFTASLIQDIAVQESPEWLQERLRAIGQRPINNIVDATNYVMFALGQPLHAYDADRFPQEDGAWRFLVRRARAGEVVSLIAEGGKDEDRDVTLAGGELLIVDASSDTPIGLAGVKGGRFAGVHAGTKNVIIEAAHFDPVLTRTTARKLGIVIDASKRFENEPSRELPPYAQAEIAALITKIAGGACAGMVDRYAAVQERTPVTVSLERTNALLGLSLNKETVRDILTRIGCALEETDTGFAAVGPFERTDLNIEEDFIEEVGRIHGYDHVTAVVPEKTELSEYNKQFFYSERVREALIAVGFSEVITSSFRKKDDISLLNALASDKGCLRSSLTPNIEEVLEKNIRFADLLGLTNVRIFEIGTVFTKEAEGVSEHLALCIGVRSKVNGHTKDDDALLETAIGEITNALDADLSFKKRGGVAELDLSAVIADLPAPTGYASIEPKADVQFRPFSSFPHISRDIALWVPAGTDATEVESVLNQHAGELRVQTTRFDEFSKDGRVSYAFRLVFQSNERTLTDAEVNACMDSVYAAVNERGWEVR